VMNLLPEGVDIEVKLAALLHDVLEDTEYSRQELSKKGYSKRTLDAVELVTKKRNDPRTYGEFIADIIQSGNRDAMQIKFADISHNSSPERLEAFSQKKRAYKIKKYTKPLEALRLALGYGENGELHPDVPTLRIGKRNSFEPPFS
jgi:(p)ppGpp synthase/HD superfamily hydrolase